MTNSRRCREQHLPCVRQPIYTRDLTFICFGVRYTSALPNGSSRYDEIVEEQQLLLANCITSLTTKLAARLT